jgi:hypothetical protein
MWLRALPNLHHKAVVQTHACHLRQYLRTEEFLLTP